MSEPTRSVRLDDERFNKIVERFGSLRGALISLWALQKIVDESLIVKIAKPVDDSEKRDYKIQKGR